MSQRQREAIEYALQNRVNDLVAQKNDSGRTYRRGTFSREFRHIDDGTYVVSFMEETAGDTTLTTDRYSVTLSGKPGSDKWAVTESELQDTFEGLVRSMPRDETKRYTAER